MLQLYSHPGSTYTHRVHIFLKYKSIPYEVIHVALDKLENRKKPFLEINPYAKVPVLLDGDFLLSESSAIMRYIEEKYPDVMPTIPRDLQSRARMNQFASQCETEFCIPGSVVYFAKKFIKEEKWDLNKMKESDKKVSRHLAILDGLIGENDYLIENTFGFVDILYAPFIFNMKYLDVEVPANVERWVKNVLSLHEVKLVLGE
ncbi:MAG: glutathione S-transferase family protein [Leptospira sp.]|nr:glutathione S-transferase family protein [Leptospira sp.]